MKTRDGSLAAYFERANEILDGIEQHSVTTSMFDHIWNRAINELAAIIEHPEGDRTMEFAQYNTRYRYNHTIPGLIAETIAAVNIFDNYKWDIKFAIDRDSQYRDGIDFWVEPQQHNHTVQVKAIRMNKDTMDGKTDLTGIQSDWVSLIDIDDYHHFFISGTLLKQLIENRTELTVDVLKSVSTKYIYNIHLYGSVEDLRIHNLISKK